MITSMIRPMFTTMVNPDSGGVAVFSPLTMSYSRASFTPVAITNTETISFYVKGLTTTANAQYLLGGSTSGAYIYYRGSDGRFRLFDGSALRQVNDTTLTDGLEHYIEMRLNPSGWDLWIDGTLRETSTGSISNFSLNRIGMDNTSITMNVGLIYGVTLGGSASWPMQSTSDDVFDGEDIIGSNDLTYNDAPNPITSNDTIETTPI